MSQNIRGNVQAVGIGASAGALDALSALLPTLPAASPFPVFVVVHLPPDKESLMAEIMRSKCKLRVCEAEDKEPIEPGTVYFAPPNYHLLVESRAQLALSSEEAVLFSRPSIDVLFESAAEIYGPGLVGIVLTGANEDGAAGLREVILAGGAALVQDPATASSPDMPRAALARCPQAQALTLQQISACLNEAVAFSNRPQAGKVSKNA